jgi:ankyrin repeat protein
MDKYVRDRYAKRVAEHKQLLREQDARFAENRKTHPIDPIFRVQQPPETLVNWETEWPQRMRAVGKSGDVAQCVRFLSQGASVNAGAKRIDRDWNLSAVMHAAARGNTYYASVLAEDYNSQGSQRLEGSTCLMQACRYGHTDLVKLLLSRKANYGAVETHQEGGKSALHWACATDRGEIVTLLLDAKADPEVKDAGDATALLVAAQCNSVHAARALLTHTHKPSDPRARSPDAENDELDCLMWAGQCGHADVLAELLACVPQSMLGAQTDRFLDKKKDRSALMYACIANSPACVRLLMDAKCPLDLRDVNGDSALLWAIYKDFAACAVPLIEGGADIELVGWKSKSVSEWAHDKHKEFGHREIVQALDKRRYQEYVDAQKMREEECIESRPAITTFVREAQPHPAYPSGVLKTTLTHLYVVASRYSEDPTTRPGDVKVSTHGVYSDLRLANEGVKQIFAAHCTRHEVRWTPVTWTDEACGCLHMRCDEDKQGVWSTRTRRQGVAGSGLALHVYALRQKLIA